MQEAAVLLAFARGHFTGAPLQGVQQLLAGDGLQAGHVAEGVDLLAGLVGDVACGDGLVADAAAVHNGHIHIQTHVVKQIIQGVGGKGAGVGLLLAHQAVALGVVVVKDHLALADGLTQLGLDLSQPGVLDGLDVLVNAGVLGDELSLDALVGDGHLADSAEVFAGLGQNDGLACLVSNFLHGDGAVGMTVDEGVQAGGVGDEVLGVPGIGSGIVAQMAQGDDHVGLLGGGVDGLLDRGVQSGAVLAAGDAVDVVTLGVLEVGRGGFGEGFGGGDADDGYLFAAQLKHLVGVQHVLAGDAVLLVEEVAGDIGEAGPLDQLHAAVHAVVKLMVAQRGQVIARGVHQLDNGLALVHGAVGGALDMVAGIHQQDALALGGQLLLQSGNGGIAQRLVDVSVHIVGVKDDNLAGCGRGLGGLLRGGDRHGRGGDVFGGGGDAQGKHHRQGKQQRQELVYVAHDTSLTFSIFFP